MQLWELQTLSFTGFGNCPSRVTDYAAKRTLRFPSRSYRVKFSNILSRERLFIYKATGDKHLYTPAIPINAICNSHSEGIPLWPPLVSPPLPQELSNDGLSIYNFSLLRRLISSFLSVQRCTQPGGGGMYTLWCSAVAYTVFPSKDFITPRRRAMFFPKWTTSAMIRIVVSNAIEHMPGMSFNRPNTPDLPQEWKIQTYRQVYL